MAGAEQAHEHRLRASTPLGSVSAAALAIHHGRPDSVLRRPVRCFELRAVQEDKEGVLVARQMFGQAAVGGIADACTECTTLSSLETARSEERRVGKARR